MLPDLGIYNRRSALRHKKKIKCEDQRVTVLAHKLGRHLGWVQYSSREGVYSLQEEKSIAVHK